MSAWTITTLTSQELLERRMDAEVLAFDRENIGPILSAAGIPFPEAKRREAFTRDGFFVVGRDLQETMQGYLEVLPDWECSEDLYISSLQVAPTHRGGALLRRLLSEAVKELQVRPFRNLRSTVQLHNAAAISIYRRLGFTFRHESDRSLRLSVSRSILDSPLARRLASRTTAP